MFANYSSSEAQCCTFPQFDVIHKIRSPNPVLTKGDVMKHIPVEHDDLATPQLPSSVPPKADPVPEATDVLLATELNKLSVEDRERVFEEIHGVDGTQAALNDKELLKQLLNEMEQELEKINYVDKVAFMKAKAKDPTYLADETRRIKFLAAESMKAKGAARRFVNFFEFKLELFGEEKLTRVIKMEDFMSNPEDKKAMECGLFQILRSRDRSGRHVIGKFHRPEFLSIPLNSRLRVFYYMVMVISDSEVDQEKGIVFMVFNMFKVVDRMDTWKNVTLLGSLPIRVNAYHICHNDRKITVLSSLGMLAMGPEYRARFRVHEGTAVENAYTMMTFGVPPDAIPLKGDIDNALLDKSDLNKWIQSRLLVEGSQPSSGELIFTPTERDVLFGRGKSFQNHPGNIRLRNFIDSCMSAYEKAKPLEKTFIAETTVETIKEAQGRFLKQDRTSNGYIEVEDIVARDKISHIFRDRRRKLKNQG